MISSMKIVLENQNQYDYNIGSIMHGALMQKINDKRYAEIIHENNLKPFSQHIYCDKAANKLIWRISSLDNEAFENIILPLIKEDFSSIYLENKKYSLNVVEKKYESIKYKDFVEKHFTTTDLKRFYKMIFITPTSFKSNGEYQIFPSIELIFKSLLSKWNGFSKEISLEDESLLEHLCEYTKISNYSLKSTKFHLERTKINSFIGNVVFRMNGPEQLTKITRMLLEFSKYSGIGIKNALGMGGVLFE